MLMSKPAVVLSLLLFYLPISISISIASPGKYAPDMHTVALWHFESKGDQPAYKAIVATVMDSSGNGYHLRGEGLKNVQGVTRQDRAVGGFTGKIGLTSIVPIPDPPNQTFETWVMWDSETLLPHNFPKEQTILVKSVSDTYSLRLSFQKVGASAEVELVIHQKDRLSPSRVRSLRHNLGQTIKPKVWYHLAYTIEISNFGGNSNIPDTHTALFWNDENNASSTPLPVIQNTFYDFIFSADGWHYRIGKRYGTGDVYFAGRLDEIRLSNIARKQFDTFILGDAQTYTRAKGFLLLQRMLFTNLPDVSQLGIHPIKEIGYRVSNDGQMTHSLFANMTTKVFENNPVENTVRTTARKIADKAPTNLYFLDMEEFPLGPSATYAERERAVRQLVEIIQWIHQERPGLRLGFYGIVPERNYWAPVLAGNPKWRKANADWRARNAQLAPVAEEADIVFPSLYTFYDNPMEWVKYAEGNIAQARRYGKKVYVFLWPQYHDSNATLRYTFLKGDFWRVQLETAYRLADGVIIWGGYKQDWHTASQLPWWTETLEFMKDKGLP